MTWHRVTFTCLSTIGLAFVTPPGLASGQISSSPSAQFGATPARGSSSPGGLEVALLRSLQANPATSIYAFATERRGSKVALRGRVGTKQSHDAAIQTAIALGVPVIDEIVIDTLAVHQAAAYGRQFTAGITGYGPSGLATYNLPGPSSSLGGFPGATSLYTNLPYTYPQPLFGKLDEPFFGFEPPAIGYPSWWGAMTAARVGLPQGGLAPGGAQQPPSVDPNASNVAPQVEPTDVQSANLPDGTIDMAIDARGVATLRGAVPSLAERITLGQKVAQTPGVNQVINLLNVKPGMVVANAISDRPPPPPVPADLPIPAVKTVEGPATVTTDVPDSVGQRALRAIANQAGAAGTSVKLKVREGMATLTGKVPTVYEAMLTYRAVQRTPGIREIDDRLEFNLPDASRPNPLADRGRPEDVEPYLEAQIRRQIGDLAHVDRVRVQGDNLDLRGTLSREEDRSRFDAILRSMPILRGFRLNGEFPAESR